MLKPSARFFFLLVWSQINKAAVKLQLSASSVPRRIPIPIAVRLYVYLNVIRYGNN